MTGICRSPLWSSRALSRKTMSACIRTQLHVYESSSTMTHPAPKTWFSLPLECWYESIKTAKLHAQTV